MVCVLRAVCVELCVVGCVIYDVDCAVAALWAVCCGLCNVGFMLWAVRAGLCAVCSRVCAMCCVCCGLRVLWRERPPESSQRNTCVFLSVYGDLLSLTQC